MNPQVRTGLTHAGTMVGGALAAGMFLATKKVDLYGLWEQLNTIVAAIAALVATATPLATMAYDVYKNSTAQKVQDLAKPEALKTVQDMPVTAATVAVADALKKE